MNKRNLTLIASTTLLGVIGFMFFSSFDDSSEKNITTNLTENTVEKEVTLFDIPANSYDIEVHKVKKNEFLSTILDRYKIDPNTVHILAEKSKDVYDVRRISAGNDYTVFLDSLGKASYLVYQPNPIDYVVFDLNNNLEVRKGKKEVQSTVRSVTGVIESSLYKTLEDIGVSPDMATKLADVYGWSVNFYKINKGDWFKINYEHREVDGEQVGSGRILSAVFGHNGKSYEAYYFETDEDGKGTYYDEKGNSLKKAFLKAPLKYSRITSRFSPRRLHPVQKVYKAHLGTDFAAPTGTPILATGDGIVVASTYAGGNGNYVKIQHDNVYATQYLHMSRRAVKRGDKVKQGDVIGYVGSTGLATGPHVCYRFWKNGKQVDPLKLDFPSAEPLAEEHRMAFLENISQQRTILASLNPYNAQKETQLADKFLFDAEKFFSQILNLEESDSNIKENKNFNSILIKRL